MTRIALVAAAALLGALPGHLRAQAAGAAHERAAGCYAIDESPAAPWLGEVERRVRLTLEPMPSDPGSPAQFLVRTLATEPSRYLFLSWALYADDQLISIVLASASDQIGLTFEPVPRPPLGPSVGSTTFFSHDVMRTTEPVDVMVRSVDC